MGGGFAGAEVVVEHMRIIQRPAQRLRECGLAPAGRAIHMQHAQMRLLLAEQAAQGMVVIVVGFEAEFGKFACAGSCDQV